MCDSHDVGNETLSSDPRSGYRLAEQWPIYPQDMHFEMGSGVAVDGEGVIYLFTRDIEHWAAHPLAMRDKMGKSSISMFDRDGNYLGKWGHSDERGFALGAHTLYIEKDGMFWTTDRDGHVVRKYHPDGTLLLTLGTFGQWGDGSDTFNGPTAMVVQENGNIVVADGYWNSRLVWFTSEGEFIKSVGTWGRGPGEFNTPHALAQDAAGRLLVADLCGGNFHDYMTVPNQIAEHRYHPEEGCYSRIQVLDAEGNFLEEWTHITPLSIAVYGDYVYASDKMSNLAILEAATGKVIDRVDSIAIYIHQLAVDAHGDLYTASVYPEHAKEKRGREGPSHRRWTRQKTSNSEASA
jgi:DNA-binding beta-propeller fold protein YncE